MQNNKRCRQNNDILYESIDIYYKNNEEEVNKSVLSEKIYNEFTKKATIKKKKMLD